MNIHHPPNQIPEYPREKDGGLLLNINNVHDLRYWGKIAQMKDAKIKVDIIVFDQGNTLVMDPFLPVLKLQKDRFLEICRKYGVVDQARQLNEEWTRANGEIDYPFISHFSQEEPIIQSALRKLAVPPDIAALLGLDLLKEYRVGLKQYVSSDPRTLEVKETLSQLKARGKRLGIFSNDREIGLALILQCMQIKPFFEYIKTSESIGIEKPDPRVFDHILEFFKVKADNIVYVGDDPVRDIGAAKRSGYKAIHYKVDKDTYSETWRDYGNGPGFLADGVIEHFLQLLDIIE